MEARMKTFLETTGITLPPLGVYDVADAAPFGPFAEPGQCIFSAYDDWMAGRSTIIGDDNASKFSCPGAGYWLCGIQAMPREATAQYLAGGEGLKASVDIMCQWLEAHPPYVRENRYVVISQLRADQYRFLKTITFFVNPDQLALLVTGAEYLNADPEKSFVSAPYGSGCGMLLPAFRDLGKPMAMIGATDIAMRKYLPQGLLAFTVTKPMFEQLCGLDGASFLHKTFWPSLQESRKAV